MILKELVKVISKPFAIIFANSDMTDKVPENWSRFNSAHLKKRGNED